MNLAKNWKLQSSLLWMLLTLSLATWWLINGLNLLEKPVMSASEIARYKFMLVSEGVVWMFLLVLGGGTLIYFILKEGQKNIETKKFVASFSHDLKTSIASLRLQAESLKEDISDPDAKVLVHRLVEDSLRLQLQLENSLQFSSENKLKVYIEKLSLAEIIDSLSYHWPDITLNYQGNDFIYGDKRALDIIMRNIIYNAKVHGEATQITFTFQEKGHDHCVFISNNGKKFDGDKSRLGRLYYRHNPSSGSGLGLYIVKSLMKRMSGHVEFIDEGFTVKLQLPKRVNRK